MKPHLSISSYVCMVSKPTYTGPVFNTWGRPVINNSSWHLISCITPPESLLFRGSMVIKTYIYIYIILVNKGFIVHCLLDSWFLNWLCVRITRRKLSEDKISDSLYSWSPLPTHQEFEPVEFGEVPVIFIIFTLILMYRLGLETVVVDNIKKWTRWLKHASPSPKRLL